MIQSLGVDDFSQVIDALLEAMFHFVPVNVDGRGDGGSDRRLFRGTDEVLGLAIQLTVQQSDWQSKVLRDAAKVAGRRTLHRFWFFSSLELGSADLLLLQDTIRSQLNLDALCFGARELTDLVIRHNLDTLVLSKFVGVENTQTPPPSSREAMLHAYVSLSDDARALRENAYDDTILMTLAAAGVGLTRADVAKGAHGLLAPGSGLLERLRSRVESLLSRGIVVAHPAGTDSLRPSPKALSEVRAASQLYERDRQLFVALVGSTLAQWTSVPEDMVDQVALALAGAFIARQLKTSEAARLSLQVVPLLQGLGNPLHKLREFLQRAGIAASKLSDAADSLVTAASHSAFVQRLVRGTMYIAVEEAKTSSAARALGVGSWRDMSVLLDAAVAIPYVCAKLYRPTDGRFSLGATSAVDSLQRLGASVRVPFFYLKECASHLLGALDYAAPGVSEDYARELEWSRNGFVSQYFRLKASGTTLPDNLTEYVATFSAATRYPTGDWRSWIDAVRGDLQPLFASFGVGYEAVPQVPDLIRKELETEYTHLLDKLGRKKAAILISNDVLTLAHMKRQMSERSMRMMCLTWDSAMLSVARDRLPDNLVVTPDVAADLAQVNLPIGDVQLTALVCSLARSQDRPRELEARILDRIISLSGSRLQEWEFRRKCDQFRRQVLEQMDPNTANAFDFVDAETEKFLLTIGIDASPKGMEAKQEIDVPPQSSPVA